MLGFDGDAPEQRQTASAAERCEDARREEEEARGKRERNSGDEEKEVRGASGVMPSQEANQEVAGAGSAMQELPGWRKKTT